MRAKCSYELEKFEECVKDYEALIKIDRTPEIREALKNAKYQLKKSKRKDYYKILGIGKTANEDEIKKAYRKRAFIHHPDRHSNSTEEEKKEQEIMFKEVGEAYTILSDPNKKSRYDNGHDLDEGEGMATKTKILNLIYKMLFLPEIDHNQMFREYCSFGRDQKPFCGRGFNFQFS